MSLFSYTVATPEDRPALVALWQQVFGDWDAYTNLFFDERFVPSQTMVARDETNHPVAMLFLLPISLESAGQSYEGRYIYAVATDPLFRSLGLSTALLEETHRRLQEQGLSFSCLVPAEASLFDYYSARGFQTAFYRRSVTVIPRKEDKPTSLPVLTPAFLPALLPLRDALFAESALYGRWDALALGYQQRETGLLGGETLYFQVEGEQGYAICHPLEDTVLIREWGFPRLEQRVFYAIADRYQKPALQLDLPVLSTALQARPFGMVYWYQHERKCETGAPPVLSLVLD